MNPFSGLNHERPNAAPQKEALSLKFEQRRANLKPHVRSYADRLYEGILGFLSSYGARSVKELGELQKSRKIRLSKSESEGLNKMLSELDSALNENELPGLKEIATVGSDEKIVFAGERIFAVNEENDVRFDEPEVSFYPLDDPEECWYFHSERNRYAIDKDGGRILMVNDHGQMWDMQGNPIGPKLTDDIAKAFSSGGKWFAYSQNDFGDWSLKFYTPDNRWGFVRSLDPVDTHFEPMVDNGGVYHLDLTNDFDIEDGFYRVTLHGEEIKNGEWHGYDDWRIIDGMVFFKKTTEKGTTFYRDDEPIYVLEDQRKPTVWEIRKGVLHVALATEDDKQTLYEVDLKLEEKPQKILSDFNFGTSSGERW